MQESKLKPWKTVSSLDLLEDPPWIRVSVERVLLPGGREIDNFYQVHLPEYTTVVARTQEGLIVMEKQYKHAAGKIIFNLPAGYLNPGEPPLSCARRELLEETGFKAESWHHLGCFLMDGNRGCGKVHVFAASGAYSAEEPVSEDSEELEVVLKEPDDALRLLFDGEIVTSGTALALSLAFLSPQSPLTQLKEDLKW